MDERRLDAAAGGSPKTTYVWSCSAQIGCDLITGVPVDANCGTAAVAEWTNNVTCGRTDGSPELFALSFV